jgi:hypothetical protein
MEKNAHELWVAATHAENHGDTFQATKLFRRVLELYPTTPQAADAAYYLTTGHRKDPNRVELSLDHSREV